MNKRHGILAVALAVSGWLALFGNKTPGDDIAEPVARTPVTSVAGKVARPMATRAADDKTKREHDILALQPRETLIGNTLEQKASAGLFNTHSWAPPPPPPPKPSPPPPPTAPPLPFTYLGKKIEDGNWEVYLGRGDNTFIARTQTLIENTYRVESIRPPQLTLTYLPLNQQQTLNIGGID